MDLAGDLLREPGGSPAKQLSYILRIILTMFAKYFLWNQLRRIFVKPTQAVNLSRRLAS